MAFQAEDVGSNPRLHFSVFPNSCVKCVGRHREENCTKRDIPISLYTGILKNLLIKQDPRAFRHNLFSRR